MVERRDRVTGPVLVLALLSAFPAHAQGPERPQSPARVSLDSAVSIDLFRGQNTVDRPNIIVDVTAVARLGSGWLVYLRPWLRQPRTTEWDKEIYQAALQYSRPGRVATRLDAGYIASPIGLGMLDTRPGVNPTIAPHFSYVTPMPVFDPAAPRVQAISWTYPLGGQFTASTTAWDARVAVVNSMPTRAFELNTKGPVPDASPVIVAGGGITPTVGLRLGFSFAHGQYATKQEMAVPGTNGRGATMAAVEAEYSFAYTKITGELTRDRFETPSGADTAYAWFVQGTQILSPRWFVAARQEGVRAPVAALGTLAGTRPVLQYSEATVGYRLSTDFTLRSSFVARKAFARTAWDQQAGVSLVWARRWW
jgi:hypothetical protein